MGQELTLKQERFVLVYLETGNASEAYRQAFNTTKMKETTVNRNAHELVHRDKIKARIEKAKAEMFKETMVTVESITAELEEARQLALRVDQGAAAVSATSWKAKLHGLIEDRKAVRVDDLRDKSADELRIMLDAERKRAEKLAETAHPPVGAPTADDDSDDGYRVTH